MVGRTYVFTETTTGWRQVAELKISDTVIGDVFGYSVAISGTTVVVGAPGYRDDAGRAYVFTKTKAGWQLAAVLKGSDDVAPDWFGTSVAVSGATAVVGSTGHDKGTGRAYVFTKTAAGWKQTAELTGSGTVVGNFFGSSVAISGTTVVVGAMGGYPFNLPGRAYVFTKTKAGWKQVAELKGANPVSDDGFGTSVAVSGATALVGAPGHGAYVFTKTAAGWKPTAVLSGSDKVAADGFGISVAVSGTTAVVGAADLAYAFTTTATGWKQAAELKGSDTDTEDEFGLSVAVSGTTAVVGAPLRANDAGRAYVFVARTG
jgi:hypothetical protein